MLIENVDGLHFQALQRGLRHLPDVVWLAVETVASAIGVDTEAEFGGDHNVGAVRRERFSDEFFIGERAVRLGRIEEGDAAFHGSTNELDCLLFFHSGPIGRTQSHAAEAEGRHFQAAFP